MNSFEERESLLSQELVQHLRVKAFVSALGLPGCSEKSEAWRLGRSFIQKHGFPFNPEIKEIRLYWQTETVSNFYREYETLLLKANHEKPVKNIYENYVQQALF